MRTAILTFTEKGKILSERIGNALEEAYVFSYSKAPSHEGEFSSGAEIVSSLWNEYDALIFVSACGIAVRLIAPHIVSKISDPAVLVIDDGGKYVISLLSGHIGRANALAKKAAEIIGAVPVITTATDSGGCFSPDSFAIANDLYITDMSNAKALAAEAAGGRIIGISSKYEVLNLPDENDRSCGRFGIRISDDISEKPFGTTLNLVPRDIVLGVGCKKNTAPDIFEKVIMSFLYRHDIPLEKVRHIASVDVKKNEDAIIRFCRKNKLRFITYSPEQLMKIEGDFSSSEFVMETVGCDNVCERSACAGGGGLIVKKQSENGVTCAAAKAPVCIDFLKEVL